MKAGSAEGVASELGLEGEVQYTLQCGRGREDIAGQKGITRSKVNWKKPISKMGKLTPAKRSSICLPSCRRLPEGHPRVNLLGWVPRAQPLPLALLSLIFTVYLRSIYGGRDTVRKGPPARGCMGRILMLPAVGFDPSPPLQPQFLIRKTSYITCPRGATTGGQGADIRRAFENIRH